MEQARRGYDPSDEKFFGPKYADIMEKAACETRWLLNRGYGIDQTVTFVGNHRMLSKRQRMALFRSIMPECEVRLHSEKESRTLSGPVFIDGFNIIITLEVALSGSLMLLGDDGVIRDLAGLRGTYHIIDKTEIALLLLLEELRTNHGITSSTIYLDKPVSNSGRLKQMIETKYKAVKDKYKDVPFLSTELVENPDECLSGRYNVISADSIVINKSESWYNAVCRIIEKKIPTAWIYRFGMSGKYA